ncbi:MAG: hypothetical protein LBQ98_01945 [Nitrososphaerota archaeon]|jgi:hypothetical protein|nr:hypothetical protein [Nitrososphaerota archaeon]
MIKQTNVIKRKTFVAREDLLNRLSEIAKTHGYSLFDLVNEIFQLEIDSNDTELNLKKMATDRRKIEDAQHAGFMLGLENIWYDMADLAYDKNKRLAHKSWFDTGIWFASRYTSEDQKTPLNAFKEDLLAFIWNAPDLQLEQTTNQVSIRVTSPRFTEAYTFLFTSFLLGAMQRLGYKPTVQEVTQGVIRLDCIKEEKYGST